MKNIIILLVAFCIGISINGNTQCSFSTPNNYGFLCSEARYLCGYELDGFQGTLLPTLSPLPQPDPICIGGSPENTQWFSFLADDPNLELEITYSNCSMDPLGPGLSVGIYEDCDELSTIGNPQHLDCETSQGYSSITLTPDPTLIIPGSIYYLYIDGYSGSVCDFEINVVSGVCTDAPPANEPCVQDCGVSNIFGDYHGCTESTETYTFNPLTNIMEEIFGCNGSVDMAEIDSILCIEWQISPATGYTISDNTFYFDSIDVISTISIQWETPGEYTITPIINFNPLFSTCRSMCECTDDIAYTVTIEEVQTIALPDVELCPGDCIDYCGVQYCSDAMVECYDRDNCVTQTLNITTKEIQFIDIGEYFICDGVCFDFNGVPYCTPNIFSVPSFTACDTSYVFELIELELNVQLSVVDSIIDCNNSMANLQGEWTTNYTETINVYWLNENGDTVSYTSDYNPTSEGLYTFIAIPEGLSDCAISIDQFVSVDDDIPSISLSDPNLDCNNLTGNIGLSTASALSTIIWSGPNSFSSIDIEPLISEGGLYSADITAENGCMTTQTIMINADFEEPILQIESDDIDCTDNLHTATYNSTLTSDNILWTMPDATTSTVDILNITIAGNYTLLVTSTNGCTSEESFTVQDLSYDPSQDLYQDVLLNCKDTVTTIDLSILPIGLSHTLLNTNTNVSADIDNMSGEIDLIEEGIYVIISEDEALGCIGYDTINIWRNGEIFSDVALNITPSSCQNQVLGTVSIDSFIGGKGPYVFIFEEMEYLNLASISFPAGNHSLTIIDDFGCVVESNFEMPSTPSFEIITEPTVIIKYNETGSFSAFPDNDTLEIISTTWTDTQGNFLAEGRKVEFEVETDSILVTIEDINGCIVQEYIIIDIDYEVETFYPNVFSPNGDGVNDRFIIYMDGTPQMIDDFKIFDRAGELIFDEDFLMFNETDSGWDGKFNDQLVVPGVYVFIIKYTLANNQKRTLSGTITVMP